MRLGIVISTTEPETVFNALRLGNYAAGQGDAVRVFLLGKGDQAGLQQYRRRRGDRDQLRRSRRCCHHPAARRIDAQAVEGRAAEPIAARTSWPGPRRWLACYGATSYVSQGVTKGLAERGVGRARSLSRCLGRV